MEILTSFIALLLVLSFLLKVSFLPRWGMAAACLLMAVAVHFVILAMAGLPVSTVNGWITVPGIMLDGAVMLVLEAVWMTAFCFARPGGRLRFPGDRASIPGLGRSPGDTGSPLQDSGLENPTDSGSQSQTWPSLLTLTYFPPS